ncbi:MAG: sigma-70 family RNA polymerase sigma factor, partial [Planctomycetota bacterium]
MNPSWEQELLAHQGFLLRLARRLAADEAAAEDLVQDALVRALERPPERRDAPRAWLATVLRRVAGRSARTHARRARRERSAARTEATAGSLAEVDERLDAHASLLAQLRRLPTGERQALFLRYGEDKSPVDIAAQLDVSTETVKTRLRRGRERLRAMLDQRYGDRSTWAALLAPGPAAGSTLGTTATVLGKGAAMSTLAKVGGAVAAAALAVLWVAGHAQGPAPAPDHGERGAPAR